MPLSFDFKAKSVTEFGHLIQILFFKNATSGVDNTTVGVLEVLDTVLQNKFLNPHQFIQSVICVLPFDVWALTNDSAARAWHIQEHPVAFALQFFT